MLHLFAGLQDRGFGKRLFLAGGVLGDDFAHDAGTRVGALRVVDTHRGGEALPLRLAGVNGFGLGVQAETVRIDSPAQGQRPAVG